MRKINDLEVAIRNLIKVWKVLERKCENMVMWSFKKCDLRVDLILSFNIVLHKVDCSLHFNWNQLNFVFVFGNMDSKATEHYVTGKGLRLLRKSATCFEVIFISLWSFFD